MTDPFQRVASHMAHPNGEFVLLQLTLAGYHDAAAFLRRIIEMKRQDWGDHLTKPKDAR